ncbi:MAG TPA: beta-propeller fold lactonase family protein [Pyrinomonadaceae bacterium]
MTRRMIGFIALMILVAAVCMATLRPTTAANNFKSGAVFVLTNQVSNAVAAFDRAPDGTLTAAGTFSTGGSGNPVAQPGDPPTDPLASQGALILSDNNKFLFAVNAGSNEISVLSVGKDELTLVDKVSSGGVRPISLTVHDDLLYVLNEGGTPNITGFTISDKGELTPLPGSTRPLTGGSTADPAEVSFSNDGALLVVTEKAANLIDVYVVGSDGVAGPPTANPSNGLTPFGFAFDQRNNLIVSEAFGGAPNASAVSSYTTALSGMLTVVSGSIPDFQTAACWIVITNNGRYVYTSNTGTGAVSSYTLASSGALRLLNSAAANIGAMSAPIDMALNNGSRYLYVHAAGLQTVEAFRVETDGSLTPIGSVGGLPFAAQGIAAR